MLDSILQKWVINSSPANNVLPSWEKEISSQEYSFDSEDVKRSTIISDKEISDTFWNITFTSSASSSNKEIFTPDLSYTKSGKKMTNVFDLAIFILNKTGPISAMKLQKLIYYCQAWSLVWDDEKLFENRIEAWASGPVVRDLYEAHRGKFLVNVVDFSQFVSGNDFNDSQKETIEIVLDSYKDKSAQWLSDQTHSELPWQTARGNLPDGVRGDSEITPASMSEYYSSL